MDVNERFIRDRRTGYLAMQEQKMNAQQVAAKQATIVHGAQAAYG